MNTFLVFIQFLDTNSDRRVMKIVDWEIINPRILNDDLQETCGRWVGQSMVSLVGYCVVFLGNFPKTTKHFILMVSSGNVSIHPGV